MPTILNLPLKPRFEEFFCQKMCNSALNKGQTSLPRPGTRTQQTLITLRAPLTEMAKYSPSYLEWIGYDKGNQWLYFRASDALQWPTEWGQGPWLGRLIDSSPPREIVNDFLQAEANAKHTNDPLWQLVLSNANKFGLTRSPILKQWVCETS